MAADRVAQGRGRADQVLAVQPGADNRAGQAGPHRQGTLADRARLRGTQARDRTGSLRGPRLARLPPSCQPLHRSLRLPGGRALPFPPSAPVHPGTNQNTCSTPRFPAARGCRSDLSATCSTRSPPSDAASPSPSSRVYPDAPAASPSHSEDVVRIDTVKLETPWDSAYSRKATVNGAVPSRSSISGMVSSAPCSVTEQPPNST